MLGRPIFLLAICLTCAGTVQAQSVVPAQAEPGGPTTPARRARAVAYQPRDLTAIHAKVRYTTLIVLPDGEDVVEATCGDKDQWAVNVRGGLVSVKPASSRIETNLNVMTTSGQVYAFILTEVSESKDRPPDFIVYLEPDGLESGVGSSDRPKYVRADQVEEFRAQATFAREDARRAVEAARTEFDNNLTAFRTTYPLALRFPYRVKVDEPPFFIRTMFHDDHLTFIQARAPELPAIYELKDGAPNLVNFEIRDGTYIVPKILDRGFLTIGKKRIAFERVTPR